MGVLAWAQQAFPFADWVLLALENTPITCCLRLVSLAEIQLPKILGGGGGWEAEFR